MTLVTGHRRDRRDRTRFKIKQEVTKHGSLLYPRPQSTDNKSMRNNGESVSHKSVCMCECVLEVTAWKCAAGDMR